MPSALFALRHKIEFGACKKFENFVVSNFLFTLSFRKTRNVNWRNFDWPCRPPNYLDSIFEVWWHFVRWKEIFRARNGFLLTDFVLQNKPKFWVVRTGPFPWNNRNYHVLSSLWNSIDVYLNLLEKETTQLSISWSSMFLVLSLSMPSVQNYYRIVNLVPEKSKIMMLN